MNTTRGNLDCALTFRELENFEKNGFIGPFKVYEPDEMKSHLRKLRAHLFDNSMSVYGKAAGLSGVTNISNYDRHLDVDFLAEHICRQEITERVVSILGRDVLCWRTEFFPKYPGDEGTDWHQAGTFSNVSSSNKPKLQWPADSKHSGTITVWTAFTESTTDNGCLQFIPGTHNTMFYDESKTMNYSEVDINQNNKDGIKRGFFGYDYRSLQKDPDWRPDESKAVNLVMEPGECMIFWSTLLHASLPYLEPTGPMRLGYSARYVPTEVLVYPGQDSLDEFGANISLDDYGAVLVAGKDEFGHNRLRTTTTKNVRFGHRK